MAFAARGNLDVKRRRCRSAFLIALTVSLGLAILGANGRSVAASRDYRFEVVDPIVHLAHQARITVRLVNALDGRLIGNATVKPRSLKMPMQAMALMGRRLGPVKPDGTGLYTFVADIDMEGDWLIEIEARVPGEPNPVVSMIAVHAEATGPAQPGRTNPAPDER